MKGEPRLFITATDVAVMNVKRRLIYTTDVAVMNPQRQPDQGSLRRAQDYCHLGDARRVDDGIGEWSWY